jgi:hypothetical protein
MRSCQKLHLERSEGLWRLQSTDRPKMRSTFDLSTAHDLNAAARRWAVENTSVPLLCPRSLLSDQCGKRSA